MTHDLMSFEFTSKGIYTIDGAAQLAHVRPASARRWSLGRTYRTPEGQNKYVDPVLIKPAQSTDGVYYLTFQHLIEIQIVARFRAAGLSMQVIRASAEIAADDYGVNHPFAVEGFFHTDGKTLFTSAAKKISPKKQSARVLHDIQTGQAVFEEIVRTYFVNIDFSAARAARFWPLGRHRGIVIDPERSFGRPIDARSGVTTRVLYQMQESGTPVPQIADWYNVSQKSVDAAIEFERSLRTVA